MSRTDVHMPYKVKTFDPGWRDHFRQVHDHRNGLPCDVAQFDPQRWRATRCKIDFVFLGRNIHCGCGMCTGQVWRRQERRRERYGWRRHLSMTD